MHTTGIIAIDLLMLLVIYSLAYWFSGLFDRWMAKRNEDRRYRELLQKIEGRFFGTVWLSREEFIDLLAYMDSRERTIVKHPAGGIQFNGKRIDCYR